MAGQEIDNGEFDSALKRIQERLDMQQKLPWEQRISKDGLAIVYWMQSKAYEGKAEEEKDEKKKGFLLEQRYNSLSESFDLKQHRNVAWSMYTCLWEGIGVEQDRRDAAMMLPVALGSGNIHPVAVPTKEEVLNRFREIMDEGIYIEPILDLQLQVLADAYEIREYCDVVTKYCEDAKESGEKYDAYDLNFEKVLNKLEYWGDTFPVAVYTLGRLYHIGYGPMNTPHRLKRARYYYRLAIESDDGEEVQEKASTQLEQLKELGL